MAGPESKLTSGTVCDGSEVDLLRHKKEFLRWIGEQKRMGVQLSGEEIAKHLRALIQQYLSLKKIDADPEALEAHIRSEWAQKAAKTRKLRKRRVSERAAQVELQFD